VGSEGAVAGIVSNGNVAAADVAKRGDQIIEGVRVLVEQHLAAILGQLAPVIEAGDRRPPFQLTAQ
jgi:hypothetical protein